ncbi:MAG: phosphotransferase [Acidobacteriaceae bacterium]
MSTEKSSEVKVHGMNGTLVEPDWEPLTLEEVQPVLREYSLDGDDVHLIFISPRPFSAAGVLATPVGQVFVKRQARTVRDAAGLAEEHRFLAHLRSRGVPVPEVLRTTAGATAVESGAWTYEVHQVPMGVDLYADALSWTPFLSADHAWSAGRMLAQVHRAAEDFKAPARRPQPLVASFTIFAGDNPSVALDRYVARHARLADYPALRECREEALRLLAPYHTQLAPWLGSLAELWTHNDLHGSNLLWSNQSNTAGAVAIIDFGLADRTNVPYDLAQAIDRNIVEWLVLGAAETDTHAPVPVHLDHLDAMLTGYEEVRPLSRAEASALAPMAALGHAEFALSEADYYYGTLHSEERAAYACPMYLCGHARWFLTPEGQGLLDFLRARAERLRQGPR